MKDCGWGQVPGRNWGFTRKYASEGNVVGNQGWLAVFTRAGVHLKQ